MIGIVIKKLLSDDSTVDELVGNNIFPLVMSLDTTRPAIVYVVESMEPDYSKDGWAGDDCTFRVTSYADSYSVATEIAHAARMALELKKGEYSGIGIERIICTGREEFYQFDADVYIIRYTFKTKIYKY